MTRYLLLARGVVGSCELMSLGWVTEEERTGPLIGVAMLAREGAGRAVGLTLAGKVVCPYMCGVGAKGWAPGRAAGSTRLGLKLPVR